MIEIWLSFNNREDVLQLPITPMYRLERNTNNQVVNLHEVGDINLPGMPGLREMTISSFFPAAGKNYYFSRYADVPDPLEAVAFIDKWARSRRPIRVIITERDINFAALIESFSYGDDDQSGDVYFETVRSDEILDFDDIGAELEIEALQKEKAELIKALKLWYLIYKTDKGEEIKKKLMEKHNIKEK